MSKELEKVLAKDRSILFAYLFGSTSRGEAVSEESDVDMAVYFSGKPDTQHLDSLIGRLEKITGEGRLDLVVLNGCEDFFLRNEILRGELLYCRDPDAHAAFFSWTLRMYEDEKLRMERYWG